MVGVVALSFEVTFSFRTDRENIILPKHSTLSHTRLRARRPGLVLMDDRSAGLAIFVCATALFTYYTVWVLVTPFIEPGHVVLSWFPDRVYAILIPAYAGACLVALVLALLGGVMLRAKPRKVTAENKSK